MSKIKVVNDVADVHAISKKYCVLAVSIFLYVAAKLYKKNYVCVSQYDSHRRRCKMPSPVDTIFSLESFLELNHTYGIDVVKILVAKPDFV